MRAKLRWRKLQQRPWESHSLETYVGKTGESLVTMWQKAEQELKKEAFLGESGGLVLSGGMIKVWHRQIGLMRQLSTRSWQLFWEETNSCPVMNPAHHFGLVIDTWLRLQQRHILPPLPECPKKTLNIFLGHFAKYIIIHHQWHRKHISFGWMLQSASCLPKLSPRTSRMMFLCPRLKKSN